MRLCGVLDFGYHVHACCFFLVLKLHYSEVKYSFVLKECWFVVLSPVGKRKLVSAREQTLIRRFTLGLPRFLSSSIIVSTVIPVVPAVVTWDRGNKWKSLPVQSKRWWWRHFSTAISDYSINSHLHNLCQNIWSSSGITKGHMAAVCPPGSSGGFRWTQPVRSERRTRICGPCPGWWHTALPGTQIHWDVILTFTLLFIVKCIPHVSSSLSSSSSPISPSWRPCYPERPCLKRWTPASWLSSRIPPSPLRTWASSTWPRRRSSPNCRCRESAVTKGKKSL